MVPDMYLEPDEDPRIEPDFAGDELTTLTGFLQWYRDTLKLKCDGLTPEQLAMRAVAPSTMSLLGLVRHMADVERGWFRRFMAGEDAPPIFWTKEHRDADWDGAVPTEECVAEAWRHWEAEVANAKRFVEEAESLDLLSRDQRRGAGSLRRVVVHMIEEYARHIGHADIMREQIDGRVGQ
jgi:uncharacterized damage-inducible protein DinB